MARSSEERTGTEKKRKGGTGTAAKAAATAAAGLAAGAAAAAGLAAVSDLAGRGANQDPKAGVKSGDPAGGGDGREQADLEAAARGGAASADRPVEERKTDRLTVGIPRAMLYYRYHVLWETFFHELGVDTVVSAPTSRETFLTGAAHANDETCLSEKIFLGHVAELVGKCDFILTPRICNLGRRREYCVRFQAMPDLTRNSFPETELKLLTYSVDEIHGAREKDAFLGMGKELGFPRKAVKRAYDRARKADEDAWAKRVRAEEKKYSQEGIRILIAGHSYVYQDPYFGGMVTDELRKLDVIPVRADVTDRKKALDLSVQVSPTCKWEVSREILGSIAEHRKKVDGIILLSAFPCGPDAMVNELLVRKLQGIPVLNLVLDGQTGAAGIETRLESFIDIIRLQQGSL